MKFFRKWVWVVLLMGVIGLFYFGQAKKKEDSHNLRFALYFPEELCSKSLDGRMLLLISSDGNREPRFQISNGPESQMVFGIDVNGLEPGETALIDSSIFGYPLESLSEIPAGEYWVQGLINRYETFHLANGHTLKLPPDKGEGQRWNLKPGNFYSDPQKRKSDKNRAQ